MIVCISGNRDIGVLLGECDSELEREGRGGRILLVKYYGNTEWR